MRCTLLGDRRSKLEIKIVLKINSIYEEGETIGVWNVKTHHSGKCTPHDETFGVQGQLLTVVPLLTQDDAN